ncbi:ectoine/hydroxyectoine ABC transporter ATP-binding protein EhuA [Streptomyces tubercidicus]|uniref:L-cystine ABC transporter ATP-binding protein YecC n=1 Tax=Streptomyces tubercidicus TaxID=47759 RepID=A0A640UWB0_9ACTN|nr:ectoine/hydroxyectoine ABC transporter ATP-binding protein EhuA [Streptomyces tubercidicus]WAU13981.1 ectoine/hydroxyectoine ABC transporter ATP-binding protein EhuA [Streptomyces tubercidicus]WSK36997.1 ectoine/hydroxyectoine ABC transporter ATP-binding protein EhuA [Streptomyces tubercidicus]WSX20727.1 ectoine/hydroxyectoine ABC transporter ATP-binding protein EhuA [Streptomyces tubercidicus]GFE39662.1 L-cystine ABC transporter ATP-binding protein YecC [Streptomyces tubercidicus]
MSADSTPSKETAHPADGGPDRTESGGGTELIRFDHVTKRFGTNTVLDSLDFTVSSGKHVTLIGPSGSGKTTILRLLMTLLKPDEGTIKVGGEYLTHEEKGGKLVPAGEKHIREVRKNIGMVFQQFNLFPNMKVLRNITEAPVHVLGMEKDAAEERARELLDLVGLTEHLDKYPTQLSGGQQQRVAIARALAMRPQVLLLDEVTSALDPELVAGVLDVLRDIAHTTDITMLCVTHEMNFARDISDDVLMFDAGRVIESGSPEKIFTEPEHERTREFLSAVL